MARDDVGLFAVADGMGGHQGGEVASAIAVETLGPSLRPTTPIDGLVDAVEQANEAVLEAGADDPDLTRHGHHGRGPGRGRRATATSVLAIVNVGDSRVYRYADGELDQLTEDHSLVADLVREGTPVARGGGGPPAAQHRHPGRSASTTRCRSTPLAVEPDRRRPLPAVHRRAVQRGRRAGHRRVLRRLADPDEAADELVRLANEGGGRDNITVVVVDVVDDGGRAGGGVRRAWRPARTIRPRRPRPNAAACDRDRATASDRRRPVPRSTDPTGHERQRAPAAAPAAAARRATATHAPAPAAHLAGRCCSSLLVLALVGGAVATIQWYGRNTYFVGFEGDQVAIFRAGPAACSGSIPSWRRRTDIDAIRGAGRRRVDDLEPATSSASLGRRPAATSTD